MVYNLVVLSLCVRLKICPTQKEELHETEIALFLLFTTNNAMMNVIIHPLSIALLIESSKTVLLLLQLSFCAIRE